MAALDAYFGRQRDEGLVLVAISIDDPKDEAAVREIMQPFTFSAGLSRDANLKAYGRIRRVPLTFMIDRKGMLVMGDWYGNPGFDQPLLEARVSRCCARRNAGRILAQAVVGALAKSCSTARMRLPSRR